MTADAFAAPLMGSIADVGQVGSGMVRVIERCVTAQAMLARPVDGQKFDVVRVIYGRTMTILAGAVWIAAFGLFLARYLPMLVQPRVDGRPG